MELRTAIDVGGTFTDLVCCDEKGEVALFKSATTPENTVDGVVNAYRKACVHYKLSPKQLGKCMLTMVYCSTTATNAIVEEKTAKTGFLSTKGHRDILNWREGGCEKPEDAFNYHMPYPKPYVPRCLTFAITERINSEGGIEVPLVEDDVRRAIRQLKEWKVRAIAVCYLWSIVNPFHERRTGQIIKEEWPEVDYCLSHEINPIIREYRRASATVIDASLRPLIRSAMNEIAKRMSEEFSLSEDRISIATSSGGMMTIEEVVNKPIYTVGSGPAMAPVMGRLLVQDEMGPSDAIVVDTGGTTFDVSIVKEGIIASSYENKVAGHIVGINRVDIESIGAGGGSIGWVDSAGMVHVGPQSAGAVPGPACYMRGGEDATVSDACTVLGYLDPEYFLGGTMRLDAQLAEKAVREKIADRVKVSVVESAKGMLRIWNQNMITAIEDITVWQGINPREFPIIAGGGAAGMTIVDIAKELKIRRVIIPKVAAGMSANGALVGDMLCDYAQSYLTSSSAFDYEGVNKVLTDLERKGNAFLSRIGAKHENRELQFSVEARYRYQMWEIDNPMGMSHVKSAEDVQRLVENFHANHLRLFATQEPGQIVEFILWKVRAINRTPTPMQKTQPYDSRDASHALKGKRSAYFAELGGSVKTPVYDGNKLRHGNEIESPAIIEEDTTTIVIPPGSKAIVSKRGNYIIDIQVQED